MQEELRMSVNQVQASASDLEREVIRLRVQVEDRTKQPVVKKPGHWTACFVASGMVMVEFR